MRLNALYPSDDPMDQYLYCFGGDSDNGDSGGTQDAQMDELDQISADFENMSQQQAAGETVTSGMSGGVGRGGSSNDNDGDGIPNSIDRTPGVDRSGIGSGDAFDQSRSYVDQAITDFAQGPAGGAGANIGDRDNIAGYDIDTLVAGTSVLGPNTMADMSFTDQMALDAARAGLANTPFSPGAASGEPQRDTRTAVERDIFSGDEYSTQDIFDVDPSGLGFETPQERISRQRRENAIATARDVAARQATEEAQRQAQMAALGVSPQDRALQADLDAQNALAEQARQEEEDALSAQLDSEIAARDARTTAPESRGIDSLMGGTVFGAPDVTGQAQDIGMGQTAAVPGITGGIVGTPEVDNRGLPSDSADGTTQAERAAATALAAAELAPERTVNGVPVTDLSVPAIDREPVFNPTVEVTDIPEDQQRPGLVESAVDIAKNLADLNADGEVSMMEGLVTAAVPGVGAARALDSYLTSNKYGTNFGSQQTNMLSAQDRFAEDYDFGGGDGGGGDEVFQPIIPPLPEDFVDEAQTPEREQFELGQYQYEPMAPVQYSYTGIPTLAPFVLQPSRTPRPIRPLYDFSGLGSLRRS